MRNRKQLSMFGKDSIANEASLFFGMPANAEKMEVTIKDDFFGKELTGEFDSIEEAKDYYASELGTFPEAIEIVAVNGKPYAGQ